MIVIPIDVRDCQNKLNILQQKLDILHELMSGINAAIRDEQTAQPEYAALIEKSEMIGMFGISGPITGIKNDERAHEAIFRRIAREIEKERLRLTQQIVTTRSLLEEPRSRNLEELQGRPRTQWGRGGY